MKLTVAIHVEKEWGGKKEKGKRRSGSWQELHWAEMVENVVAHQLISHEIFPIHKVSFTSIFMPEKKAHQHSQNLINLNWTKFINSSFFYIKYSLGCTEK